MHQALAVIPAWPVPAAVPALQFLVWQRHQVGVLVLPPLTHSVELAGGRYYFVRLWARPEDDVLIAAESADLKVLPVLMRQAWAQDPSKKSMRRLQQHHSSRYRQTIRCLLCLEVRRRES